MKIGIFGGSFDPPHRGHLLLARAALRELKLDRLWVVPARLSPLKKSKPFFSARERLALCRAAFGKIGRTSVSDLELKRSGPSYTVRTLSVFRRKYPGAEFYLVLGSDAAREIRSWRKWKAILAHSTLAVARRQGDSAVKIPEGAAVLRARIPQVSSSTLRKALSQGDRRALRWVPPPARSFAQRRCKVDPRDVETRALDHLRKTLPKDRFHHVLGVVGFAEELARRHGLDPARARLAGALHDGARCWPPARLLRYARRRRLRAPDFGFIARFQPMLLHSYVGADLARRKFGVRDREVLGAIAKHSLGGAALTAFERIIYLADLLSPERTFRHAARLRRLALRDLDAAFLEGMRVKLEYCAREKQAIHPETLRAWNRAVSKSHG